MRSLFKDDGTIVKVATKEVTENPQNWPHEIKAYLMETAPFVGKYNTNVNIDRMDEKTGHAFGSVLISTGATLGEKKVQVPFIVKERKLFPMDVIVHNGSVRPLTEGRLSEVLFRPQLFDSVVKADDIKPSSVVGALESSTPPDRSGHSGSAIITKAGSLLTEIKDTISESDLKKTASDIAANPALRDRVLANAATLSVLKVLHDAETMEKAASDLSSYVRPTVMQVSVTSDDKYRVKTANPKAFKERVEVLERTHALAKLGSEVVRAVDNIGTLTVSTNATVDRDKMEAKYASVSGSGVYKVVSLDGCPVKGIVLNKLANLDGRSANIKLFATGEQLAIQEEISGEKLAGLSGSTLPSNYPSGLGVFYWDTDAGVKATVPLIVHNIVKKASEINYDVSTLLDEVAILTPSAVKDITKIGGEVLVPDSAKFMSLPGTSVLPIASVKDLEYRRGQDKTAKVNIKHANGKFAFSGDCGLDKVATKENLTWDDAVFMSACLGMNPEFAENKLAQSIKYANGTTIKGLTEIKPMEEYEQAARDKLASVKDPLTAYMEKIRQDLWKEAATVEDEDTVDKMLSLNYINPDNIKVFVEYLPKIEAAQRYLCELLLASRIGLKEVDEKSLTSAIKGVEKAIEGLKVLLNTYE